MKCVRFFCPPVFLLMVMLLGACSDHQGHQPMSVSPAVFDADLKFIDAAAASLVGVYEGRYYYVTGLGGPTQTTYMFDILCRFSGKNYWISNRGYWGTLCESWGQYTLGDGVELVQKDDGSPCEDPELNPVGHFDLRQTPDDSLILTQIDGDIMKQFLLVPVSSDTAALYVQPMHLDFSTDLNELTLAISNHGEGELDYWIERDCDWVIGINPQGGTLTTETVHVAVTVDRSWLQAGEYSGTVYVISNGGVKFVHVSIIKE
ncbi:MAG: hypothetical protein JSV52_05635 [Candidatus Zixiibacteriota bacterium]|nr:MAG: hypothetical protein JSV52_05635 [candidate division Zixibacteria bacterium]